MSVRRRLLWPSLIVLVLLVLFATTRQTPIVRGTAKQMGGSLPVVLSAQQAEAKALALADSRVQSLMQGQRTEVMGVQPVGQQVTEASKSCLQSACSLVQIYDFDRNATIQAIVDTGSSQVLDVLLVQGTIPGINARLADRARELAFNAPEVIEVLGNVPTSSDWQPMDANLNGTSCGDDHYCVAPSFRVGDYIMWAFVDLTEDKFVGIAWTSPGPDGDRVEYNKPRDPEGCPASGTETQGDWVVNYDVTGSDGLRIHNVQYGGQTVITSAKLAEWHADYGGNGYRDSTGCGGGGGFPIYPIGDPFTEPLVEGGQTVGFALRQIFSMGSWGNTCNYRYEQRYMFYFNGSFRVAAGAYGKGCGTNSLYRPLLRIDIAAGGTTGNDLVSRWDGAGWSEIHTETRFTPAEVLTNPDTLAYRIEDTQNGDGYTVEPGVGQWTTLNVPERGDNPYVFVLQHHPNEGDTDLPVFPSCCNVNNHGPEVYLNGESTHSENVVLWYIPQMQTDAAAPDYYCWTLTPPETYPCFSGPLFRPLNAMPSSYESYLPLIVR